MIHIVPPNLMVIATLLVDHKEEFIELLRSENVPADASMPDAELITLYIDHRMSDALSSKLLSLEKKYPVNDSCQHCIEHAQPVFDAGRQRVKSLRKQAVNK